MTAAGLSATAGTVPDFTKRKGGNLNWNEITPETIACYFERLRRETAWLVDEAPALEEGLDRTYETWNGLFSRVEEIWEELGEKRIVTAYYVRLFNRGVSLLHARLRDLQGQGVRIEALDHLSPEWKWYVRLVEQIRPDRLGVTSHRITASMGREIVESLVEAAVLFGDSHLFCLPELANLRFPGDPTAQQLFISKYTTKRA